MNTLSLSATSAVPSQLQARPAASGRGLGVLLIAEALLSFAPVAVLGAAIGWPASLDKPAGEQLSAIAANADMVALGYGLYLLYSILVAPVMIGLAARAFGDLQRPVAATVAALAMLSALARAIGILRWLTVMPALAAAHAAADTAARAQIELVAAAINEYGGGIGEILGVSIFMALSLGTLCVAALLRGGLPRWLAGTGLVSALMLAALALPSLRIDLQMPVAAAVSMLSLWMLVAGVWLLGSRRD
jgi:Domain of unknown function (DUF4386)